MQGYTLMHFQIQTSLDLQLQDKQIMRFQIHEFPNPQLQYYAFNTFQTIFQIQKCAHKILSFPLQNATTSQQKREGKNEVCEKISESSQTTFHSGLLAVTNKKGSSVRKKPI
jgi:hypothetical protein